MNYQDLRIENHMVVDGNFDDYGEYEEQKENIWEFIMEDDR